MTDNIQGQIVAGLLLWSLLSLGTAAIGLYARPGEFWRSFWFMSGIWGLIDGLIGWAALIGDAQPARDLIPILKLNTGLDVLYLAVGVALLTRRRPMLRGFGLAVLIQGAFLLAFDGYWWWRCAGVAGP